MKKIISAVLLAMLGIGSFGFIANLVGAETQFQGTWVRMRGFVTQWGPDPVFGWINAHAGMVDKNGTYNEWARVHATWSYDRPRLNCSEPPPPENFTFTLYAAKLVNTTDVALDQPGYNFYVSGLWNVGRITTTVTFITDESGQVISVTFTRQLESILTEAQGELRVFANWTLFELSIEGIDLLSGIVRFSIIRQIEIKVSDINDDGKVDLIDLVRVAKRYRTVPGLFNYDHEMDMNFNDEIDIGDLTTVAAQIEG